MSWCSEATLKRFEELIGRAETSRRPAFTHFLAPASGAVFFALCRRRGLAAESFGACPGAERAVWAAFVREPPAQWPVRVLRIRWAARFGSVSHRDVLGAVLALGFERDRVGDIRVGEGEAYLVLHSDVAEYAKESLREIGRCAVRAEFAEEVPLPPPAGERVRVNVASSRLDAAAAAVWRLNRAEAQELIRQGRALVNWQICDRPDRELKTGDAVTVRGLGRFRLLAFGGLSRKGRSFLEIERFGGNP